MVATYVPQENFAGSDSFTFKVNDAVLDSAAATVTITVNDVTPPTAAPLLLSPANGAQLTTSQVPLDWSDVADSNGVTYEVIAQPMTPVIPTSFGKTGLTVSNAKSGVLLAGAYQWRVRAVDGAGNAGPWSEFRTFTILFGITTTQLPNGKMGVPYDSTIEVTGGTAPYVSSLTSGALPPGLSLSPVTRKIAGTPTAPGIYNFTVTVADGAGLSTSQSYTITVDGTLQPLTITSNSPLPQGTAGLPLAHVFEATGGYQPYLWSITSGPLPEGLSFSAETGLLSGVPTAGSALIEVTVSDSAAPAQSVSKKFALLVVAVASNLSVTSPYPIVNGFVQLPTIVVGTPFSTRFFSTGAIDWSVTSGSLPSGLNLDPANGQIHGTPTEPGDYLFVVRAVDAIGGTTFLAVRLPVVPNGGLTLVILSADALAGSPGTPFTFTLTAAGGEVSYTWAVIAGTLPPGMTLNASTGEIFGMAETGGTWTFTVQVSDSMTPPQTGTRTFSISTGPAAVAADNQGGDGGGGGGCGLVGLEALLLLLALGLRSKLR